MDENLFGKYFPLYYQGEDGEFYELGEKEINEILEDSGESLLENLFSDLSAFAMGAPVLIDEYFGGKWTLRYYCVIDKFEITAEIEGITKEIPVYSTTTSSNANFAFNFYVSAFKTGTIKKLTNLSTGDIINIDKKDYGEG